MFTFCKIKGGWWLACNNLDQLLEFHERTRERFGKALIHSALKDDNELTDWDKNISLIAELEATRSGDSTAVALSAVMGGIVSLQATEIHNGKTVWINKAGGWNTFFKPEQAEATVSRKNIIFPCYTKEDIRISKYTGNDYGRHFYAYIGDIEISEGEGNDKKIKWNTYDEAYKAALKYCVELV